MTSTVYYPSYKVDIRDLVCSRYWEIGVRVTTKWWRIWWTLRINLQKWTIIFSWVRAPGWMVNRWSNLRTGVHVRFGGLFEEEASSVLSLRHLTTQTTQTTWPLLLSHNSTKNNSQSFLFPHYSSYFPFPLSCSLRGRWPLKLDRCPKWRWWWWWWYPFQNCLNWMTYFMSIITVALIKYHQD